MNGERWLPVVGYEGAYEVSNLGRIRSLGRTVLCNKRPKIIQPSVLTVRTTKRGYLNVCLSRQGVCKYPSVHRLVGQAFLPKAEPHLHINHKNGIKTDNRVENLEWVTHRDNVKHAFRELGVRNGRSILHKTDIPKIRAARRAGASCRQLAQVYGVSPLTIWQAATGRTWARISASGE